MQYLSVRATEGLLSIDGIPFQTLEFTHDIDSLKDLCTSLVKFDSKLDEWNLIRMDAVHYLFSLNAQACSPRMLKALGDSLLDSLASFKTEPIEGELIINVVEKGIVSLTVETSELGGVTHIDHVHEERQPRGRKRPLREVFSSEQITLKMPWMPLVTDVDVLSQLAKGHGIDNLGEMVSVSNAVPGNTRLSHFTLTADSLNDRFHGTYTVEIVWTGRRPHRPASRPEPEKRHISCLFNGNVMHNVKMMRCTTIKPHEVYYSLAKVTDGAMPDVQFTGTSWNIDPSEDETEVELIVSVDDPNYHGSLNVHIELV